ncbi:MAG TPA: alpha/beta hydrolase [Candidatus Acidoferrales bacterium]|jgi:pimeloyl-ACP methyl ester carboxylesterase|nr:alpha/beta hydrolase [Candidatus Acidoferrales bacterium]
MNLKISTAIHAALIAVLVGGWFGASAQDVSRASQTGSIRTFSTADIARTGFFYVGGHYVGSPGQEVMNGAEYVEVMVPKKIRRRYPIVFLHGAGQTGTDWLQTPDGRAGWAYYFIKQGYVVYMVDYPARGRSAYVPDVDGPLTIRTAPQLEKLWTDLPELGDWPQAKNYTQWPSDAQNRGKMGDPVFDNFAKTQVQYLAGANQDKLNLDAHVALLERIGIPVILVTHSQGGSFGWQVADARPKLVKAIITAEPAGPPIQTVDTAKQVYTGKGLLWGVTNLPLHYDPPINDPSELQVELEPKSDGPGLIQCWRQKEPAHRLVNLQGIPVLDVSAEASYHRVFDSCDAKWLNQAGVKTTYVPLESVGLPGNAHEMMLEKNSDAIAAFFEKWIEANVR